MQSDLRLTEPSTMTSAGTCEVRTGLTGWPTLLDGIPRITNNASVLAWGFLEAVPVATLVIRNVEDALHVRLKARAAAQGRSMEEEARLLLREGLAAEPAPAGETLASAMRALFQPLGGVEFPCVREPGHRPPPDFSGPEWNPPSG